MALALAAGAAVVAAASFVQGLAGFGIGLVSLAFLPFLMSPTDAVVLMTLYATVFCGVIFARTWRRRVAARTIKANLQAFLVVNQLVILLGYWWAGLLTPEVWRLAAVFALPALVGLLAGMRLFDRVDAVKFRRLIFAILLASGVALLLRG